MHELVNTLLDSVCHRSGPYAEVLPLCLRCSSVYAGALAGLAFEWSLMAAGRAAARRADFVLNACALFAMAVVGFGRLYGVLAVPDVITVFTAMWFGSAVAFFASVPIAAQLDQARGRRRGPLARVGLPGVLAGWSVAVSAGWMPAVYATGLLAWIGLPLTFLAVNGAFALVLFGGIRREGARICAVLSLSLPLVVVEFLLFHLWRSL
jgi:uncharacterized membrane protein